MKKGKISLAGLFLSSLLGAIIFTVLFLILDIATHQNFVPILIFAIFNVVVILSISTFSKLLINKISLPMYIAVAITTTIYTFMQFSALALLFALSAFKVYLLFQLIILFVYFLVIIPLIKAGSTLANKN